jgi:hypothetical protein
MCSSLPQQEKSECPLETKFVPPTQKAKKQKNPDQINLLVMSLERPKTSTTKFAYVTVAVSVLLFVFGWGTSINLFFFCCLYDKTKFLKLLLLSGFLLYKSSSYLQFLYRNTYLTLSI